MEKKLRTEYDFSQDFFEFRSLLLNKVAKFKQICERAERNFKVEMDEIFEEANRED